MSIRDNDIEDIINQIANISTSDRSNILTRNNMAQPSIRDYMDTIPPFNGDPVLISNFILACENVIEILGRPNDVNFNSFVVAHIRSKLIGRAAQLIAVRNLKTWRELKEAILFTFGDQRDEDALMRDLIMLKQENNESSLRFGEKCQDTLSLLVSKVNSTAGNDVLRTEKIKMYRNLAVKTFMKGLKEPYSLIVRCRNPQTLEEAINIISDENNLNYIRKSTQLPNHLPAMNRNPQMNQFQMPRRFPLPTYNARTTTTPIRPPMNQFNRPYQWPSRPNYWQQQAIQRSNPNPTPFRPQIAQNTQQNNSTNFSQRRSQNYPVPMDTSSGNTNIQRTNPPRTNYQRPQYVFEELHYSDVNQDYQEYEEYPVDQYEANSYYMQQYQDFYQPNIGNFQESLETETYPAEQEISTNESENQDFQQDPPPKTPK